MKYYSEKEVLNTQIYCDKCNANYGNIKYPGYFKFRCRCYNTLYFDRHNNNYFLSDYFMYNCKSHHSIRAIHRDNSLMLLHKYGKPLINVNYMELSLENLNENIDKLFNRLLKLIPFQ